MEDAAGSGRRTVTRGTEALARSAALERLRAIRDGSASETAALERPRVNRDASARIAAHGRPRAIRDAGDRVTALERLRAIRDARPQAAATVNVKVDDASIYDTVAEEEYAALVARRRKEAGEFVGFGYVSMVALARIGARITNGTETRTVDGCSRAEEDARVDE